MPATILHLNTETSWRGGEAQTLELARGLAARGYRCLLVGQPDGELLRRAAGAGLESRPLAMRGEIDLPAAWRLARLVRRESVGMLHYHTAHAVTLGSLASLFCGRRPAVAARRVSFRLRCGPLARIKYRFRVDRVIAVSRGIRDDLVRQGIDARRVEVVHSGIDPARFAQGNRSRFRASLRSPDGAGIEGALLIGTAAHLAAHKGIDLFLRAAAAVAPAFPAARFIVVGGGEAEPALRDHADRLGIAGQVLFAGFRDDMPDVYAGLDIFVLASTSGEGSPAVVKEAMAAGVPLVASALDGVREIVDDERHGLLTPPGDSDALGRAIMRLAADRDLGTRLASSARQRVREFTLDSMVERTAQVYRSIQEPR